MPGLEGLPDCFPYPGAVERPAIPDNIEALSPELFELWCDSHGVYISREPSPWPATDPHSPERRDALVRALWDAGERRLARRLDECGRTYRMLRCQADPAHQFAAPCKCRSPYCPDCGPDEQSRLLDRYTGPIAVTMATKRPDERAWIITLTQPEGVSREKARGIWKAFNRVRRRKAWPQFRAELVVSEVAHGKDGKGPRGGQQAIHLHVLAIGPRRLAYAAMRKEWEAVNPGARWIHCDPLDDGKDVYQTARHMVVYLSQRWRMEPEQAAAWYHATRGMRLLRSYGEWYNVAKKEETEPRPAVCPYCGAPCKLDLEVRWLEAGEDMPWTIDEVGVMRAETAA